jgi:hypothetical protein
MTRVLVSNAIGGHFKHKNEFAVQVLQCRWRRLWWRHRLFEIVMLEALAYLDHDRLAINAESP